jgi:hypothetical protein
MRSSLRLLVLLGVAFVACGKSAEERRADVETCSANHTTASPIARCLQTESGWKEAAADSAALDRVRELVSVQTAINAMTSRADSQHTGEVQACDRVLVDLKTCLITRHGWEEDRATAADDSLWASRAVEHQRQIRACLGRRGVGTGACLQLHYKWPSRRALTLDDSIRRANVR